MSCNFFCIVVGRAFAIGKIKGMKKWGEENQWAARFLLFSFLNVLFWEIGKIHIFCAFSYSFKVWFEGDFLHFWMIFLHFFLFFSCLPVVLFKTCVTFFPSWWPECVKNIKVIGPNLWFRFVWEEEKKIGQLNDFFVGTNKCYHSEICILIIFFIRLWHQIVCLRLLRK